MRIWLPEQNRTEAEHVQYMNIVSYLVLLGTLHSVIWKLVEKRLVDHGVD